MRTTHGFISVESTRLPIVDITYQPGPEGASVIDDFRETFEEYSRLARRGQPLLYLCDMRRFDPLSLPASRRREAAEVFQRYADLLVPVSVAEARVITSPLTRGIVTAFDWLTSANKWPCRQVASTAEAETWLRAQLARARPGEQPRT